MGQKIDIRIMNLNKWYIPKSFSMEEMAELKESVVLGYFDAFQVRDLQIDSKQKHPFIAGYEKFAECKKKEKRNLVDYSSQEQMLFLNICEENEKDDGICFAEDTVKTFWEDETCPYVFLSLIHINHSGKLNKALKKIHDVFQENYLSYISFDYCDIVLFAHHLQISEFLINIKRLFEIKEGEEAVIFDTFSMVSFQPSFTRDQNNSESLNEDGNQSEFQATINLSIRNYEKFEEWYKELKKPLKENIKKYNMFGRHDVSLVNDHADSAWLMRMMGKLHEKNESERIFWTFETYIKILHTDKIVMTSNESKFLGTAYKNVEKNLEKEIKELENVFLFSRENRYLLPVYEVRDCICSIAKNSFAEEFIYCVYESFLHFVSYIKNEVEHLRGKGSEWPLIEMKIADVYDKYFTALNTLVNSTMHNERQFVQATAFNAVFYSVPPKIMAFYNAYIYRIKQILCDDDCKEQYTFLIYPSFCPTISVEQISLNDDSLPDRILTVKIREESLYDVESVIYQMVHEQAHYVGHKIRCRATRREKIIETLLKHIVLKGELGDEVSKILLPLVNKGIESEVAEDKDSDLRNYNYLRYIVTTGKSLWQILKNSSECKEAFREYYQRKIEEGVDLFDEDLSNFGIERKEQQAYIVNLQTQYIDVKYKLFSERIDRYDTEEEEREYESLMKLLRNVYRESYADLQMILVLAMGAEDYLNTFFMKQKMSIEEMRGRMASEPEYMLRISTIYRVMTDSGIWEKDTCSNKEMETIIGLIDKYNIEVGEATDEDRHAEVQQNIRRIGQAFEKYDFSEGIKLRKTATQNMEKTESRNEIENESIVPVYDAAIGLYEYLLEVLKNSLEEYSKDDKKKKIREVRKIIGKVLAFENVIQVFDSVEEELDYYKEEGCKI